MRRTLVDRLERRIAEAGPIELDWLLEVRLACQRQDMERKLEIWDEESVKRYGEPEEALSPRVSA